MRSTGADIARGAELCNRQEFQLPPRAKSVYMRTLVIEDEVKTAKFLKKGLSEAGLSVEVSGDGLDGLHLALEVEFDLVILDVMIPSLDGWEVLTRLRQAGRTDAGALSYGARCRPRAGTRIGVGRRRLPGEAVCLLRTAGAGAIAAAPRAATAAGNHPHGRPGNRSTAPACHPLPGNGWN